LLYDKNYIEQLYIDYQKNECDDVTSYQNLKNSLEGKDVLVIGPGKNIIVEKHRISKYIADYKPIVIAINFIPVDWRPNYLFITNSKRYVQQAASISQNEGAIKFIATSNVTKSNGKFDFVLDYESLIDRDAVFMDNSFIMLLKVLIKSSVKHIELAGLDGYSTNGESNYFSSKMEYDYAKQKGEEINAYVNKTLKEIKNQISLEFLTQTVYEI
jgi:4-hydroxy 2-oxovalerate aldolase